MRICLAVVVGICVLAPITYAGDSFVERDARYRLRPNDVLAVSYRYTPELNATVTVQPDGFVTFPQLGDMKVSGLTVAEARERLKDKASERLNNPEITLELKGFEGPSYIVGGEVGQPGRFYVNGPITALRAIQVAGGFKTSAKTTQVLLIRPINDTEGEAKIIDLKQVLTAKNLKEDVLLRSGDMLIVPERRFTKVERIVRLANFGMYINPFSF